MTQQLRSELERIAQDAPRVHVPEDTWTRGRRAHRRSVLVTVAAVLALVASLGGLAALLPLDAPRIEPAAPRDWPGEVPSKVYPVPPGFDAAGPGDTTRWAREYAETDLRIGRASVVMGDTSQFRPPAVVTARDGVYHFLDLPGYVLSDNTAMMMRERDFGIALSPDGRYLAWAYGLPVTRSDEQAPIRCGIRIADLTTGEVRDIDLRSILEPAAQAVIPMRLVWAPDSSWLAWSGRQYDAYGGMREVEDTDGRPTRATMVGVVAPGETTSTVLPRAFGAGVTAVDSNGSVTAVRAGGVTRWERGETTQVPGNRPRALRQGRTSPGVASPSGRYVLLGSARASRRVYVYDTQSGRYLHRSSPSDRPRQTVIPRGWQGEDRMVVEAQPLLRSPGMGQYMGMSRIATLSSPAVPAGEGFYSVKTIAQQDGDFIPEILSVAGDLVPTGRHRLDASAPDFPTVYDPWQITGAVVAGVAVLLSGFLLLRIRHRRLTARGAGGIAVLALAAAAAAAAVVR